jgi:D-serine deaminase-like pyridoxal phosphate-dependent protein
MHADYRIADVSSIISPGLVVFRELVTANIDRMIEIARDPARLRPHCKTHKMREVAEMELARGITKHKAATIAEAEMLAQAGVKDVFLAYNIVGPNIARAVEFRRKFPDVRFSVTGDHPRPVAQLGEAMQSAGTTIDVLLDLDIGRNRTGLPPGEQAIALYEQIAHSRTRARRLHVYDGHWESPIRPTTPPSKRRGSRCLAFRDSVDRSGLPVRDCARGTRSFQIYATFTEPTAGSKSRNVRVSRQRIRREVRRPDWFPAGRARADARHQPSDPQPGDVRRRHQGSRLRSSDG